MATDVERSEAAEVRGGPITERRVTEELARFCVELTYEDLPAEVVEAVKYFAYDYAGVALRGSQEDSSQALYRAVMQLGEPSSDGATIAGHTERLKPVWAAFANGASAHAIELDDTHQEGSLHPGVVVFPAALALAETEGTSGKDFVAAVVAGYEVASRLGMALQPPEHYGHGFHPTATTGAFASAVVAAKLMKLNLDQTLNALGIAGSQAAGSMEFLADGAWTKRFHPGWASHAGIVAAQLARNGFTGPHSILEGKSGFLRSYSDRPRVKRVLDGLGRDYQILRTAIKPHACCRYNQGPIDCVLNLVAGHDVNPADITGLKISLLTTGFPLVGEPVAQKRRPASVVDAQFSAHYAAAVAALRGRAGLDEYRPENLSDPEIIAFMDRVECVRSSELDALFPQRWPAAVEVTLSDGTELREQVDFPKGDPQNPLSWDELTAKFEALVSGVVSGERAAEIRAAAKRLDEEPAAKFARLLAAG